LYSAGIGIFNLFGSCDLELDLMTFIYDLSRIAERYSGCENMNFLHQGFRKLSSDRHMTDIGYVYTADRQTNRTEIIYHAASRVVNKKLRLREEHSASIVLSWCTL